MILENRNATSYHKYTYECVRLSSTVSTDLVNVLVLDAAGGAQVVVADHLRQAVLQMADVRFHLVAKNGMESIRCLEVRGKFNLKPRNNFSPLLTNLLRLCPQLNASMLSHQDKKSSGGTSAIHTMATRCLGINYYLTGGK